MGYDDLMRDLENGAYESDMRAAAARRIQETTTIAQAQKTAAKVNNILDPITGLFGGDDKGKNRATPNLDIKGGPRLKAFLKAEAMQESGGNYSAVGVPTRYGTALGKYQILDSNFLGEGGWDQEVLGREITRKQYMNRPQLQEKLAQGKLTQYFRRYGAIGAAKSWYAGEGNHDTNSDSPQYGGPSINDYAQAVYARMMDYLKR